MDIDTVEPSTLPVNVPLPATVLYVPDTVEPVCEISKPI